MKFRTALIFAIICGTSLQAGALEQVSIPTLSSPPDGAIHVTADTLFETSTPTTFAVENPEATSPAVFHSNEFLISSEVYFQDTILGGSTGYSDFSVVGDKQYQVFELSEKSNIIIDGKRLSSLRVYSAPVIEFMTEEGEVVGSMSAVISDLSHMTSFDNLAIIKYTRYTNGAKLSWQLKSSPTSPAEWVGNVEAEISEKSIYWSVSPLEAGSPSHAQEFHRIDAGGVGIEFDLNGVRKSHYRTMKEIGIDNEKSLGNFPQVSIKLDESKEVGEIVTASFFISSPHIFNRAETEVYSTQEVSSTLNDFNLILPERYTISARQKVTLSNGKTVTSNWSGGQKFTTATEVETELAPVGDITEFHVKTGEPAEIRFITKNIGQVEAHEALNRFKLTELRDNSEVEDYLYTLFSLSSPDSPEINKNGYYLDNFSLSKSFSFEEFPVGTSKEIIVKILVDENNQNSIRKLEYKACTSHWYCSSTTTKTIKICIDGVCHKTAEELRAEKEESSDSAGGHLSYIFLMLLVFFATKSTARRSKN